MTTYMRVPVHPDRQPGELTETLQDIMEHVGKHMEKGMTVTYEEFFESDVKYCNITLHIGDTHAT